MVRASGLRTVEKLSQEALRVHPRAKLTVAGRRLLVERVLVQGWPVVRAAEAQGVSAPRRTSGCALAGRGPGWSGRSQLSAPDQPTAAAR